MKKHLLICAATSMCCLSFVSCKKSGESPTAKPEIAKDTNKTKTNLNYSVMLKLVNKVRTRGCNCKETDGSLIWMDPVPPLTWSDDLAEIAKAHTDEMAREHYSSHINMAGKDPGDRMSDAGYIWSDVAENIANGQRDENEVFNAWITSHDHHCQHIMNPYVKEMGAARSAGNTNYWTQLFGAKR